MQAVIAAGGIGSRLGALAKSTPKPMIEVDGRPFLETIILNLQCFGITDFLLSVGHVSEVIEHHFGDGSRWGVSIGYVRENPRAGTGGALALARDRLAETFLMLKGDSIFDVNYVDLAQLLKHSGAMGALALRSVDDASRFGSVRVAADGLVTAFGEKATQGAGLVNGGVYAFRREVAEHVTHVPYSIETELIPILVSQGTLVGRSYEGFFIDIGLPERLASARETVGAWWRKPLAILDRDGVINKDNHYVCEPSAFRWVEGAPAAIKLLNDSGYRVVVATNQAGIARGYYSEERFHAFMAWIADQLAEHGAHLDAVYYCPHHPEFGLPPYRQRCECRKPKPGMVLSALQDFQAPPDRSFLIGDKAGDCEAAQRAGIQAYQFDESHNLLELVQVILPKRSTQR